jgi:AcrR family transcriptional regulator
VARTRSAQFDAQRQTLLANAARLFAERGFASASMAAVACACGVSKALLYHYYTNKEAMLFDIMQRHTARLQDIAADAAAANTPPRERLSNLIHAFLDEYQTSQHQHRVLIHDLKFLSAEQAQDIIARQRAVVDAFAAAIAAAAPGRLPPRWRTPLTMLLFGAINWTFTWLRPDGALKYQDYAQLVVEFFLAGLAGVVPAAPAAVLRVRR